MTSGPAPRRRGRLLWGAAALGVVMAVLGAALWLGSGSAEAPTAREATPPSEAPTSAAPVIEGAELPAATDARRELGDPDRITIPALDVASPIVPIGAPGGVLTPPADPQTLGWWADGSRPGDARGSALVTGHTVSTGGGALDDLEELTTGDVVVVGSGNRSLDYSVRTTEVLGKGELAQRAEELFDQGVPGRLVLITCEDWNGSEYLSNVVVTAVPADAS